MTRLLLVVVLLYVQGVNGKIEISGASDVNGTFRESAALTWTVKNTSPREILQIMLNNVNDAPVFSTSSLHSRERNFTKETTQKYADLLKRSSAHYVRTGNTTVVYLDITNLQFGDIHTYILYEATSRDSYPTSLFVGAAPLCSHNVDENDNIITVTCRGNPEPKLTWEEDSTLSKNINITNIGSMNYTYRTKYTSLKACESKVLNYVAEGYGSSFNGSVELKSKQCRLGDCSVNTASRVFGGLIIVLSMVMIVLRILVCKRTKDEVKLCASNIIIISIVIIICIILLAVDFCGRIAIPVILIIVDVGLLIAVLLLNRIRIKLWCLEKQGKKECVEAPMEESKTDQKEQEDPLLNKKSSNPEEHDVKTVANSDTMSDKKNNQPMENDIPASQLHAQDN